jgi:hypothetical protein
MLADLLSYHPNCKNAGQIQIFLELGGGLSQSLKVRPMQHCGRLYIKIFARHLKKYSYLPTSQAMGNFLDLSIKLNRIPNSIKRYHFKADQIWPLSITHFSADISFHISDYLLRDSCGLEVKISKPDSTVGGHISGIAQRSK